MHSSFLKINTKIVWFVLVVIYLFFLLSNTAIAADEDFSWLPNSETNIARYEIHFGMTNGGPYPNVVNIGKPAPVDGRIHGVVIGLTYQQQYYFVCVAVNDQEIYSNNSEQVEVTIGLGAPTNLHKIN